MVNTAYVFFLLSFETCSLLNAPYYIKIRHYKLAPSPAVYYRGATGTKILTQTFFYRSHGLNINWSAFSPNLGARSLPLMLSRLNKHGFWKTHIIAIFRCPQPLATNFSLPKVIKSACRHGISETAVPVKTPLNAPYFFFLYSLWPIRHSTP